MIQLTNKLNPLVPSSLDSLTQSYANTHYTNTHSPQRQTHTLYTHTLTHSQTHTHTWHPVHVFHTHTHKHTQTLHTHSHTPFTHTHTPFTHKHTHTLTLHTHTHPSHTHTHPSHTHTHTHTRTHLLERGVPICAYSGSLFSLPPAGGATLHVVNVSDDDLVTSPDAPSAMLPETRGAK